MTVSELTVRYSYENLKNDLVLECTLRKTASSFRLHRLVNDVAPRPLGCTVWIAHVRVETPDIRYVNYHDQFTYHVLVRNCWMACQSHVCINISIEITAAVSWSRSPCMTLAAQEEGRRYRSVDHRSITCGTVLHRRTSTVW